MPSKTAILIFAGILGSLLICTAAPVSFFGENTSLIWRVGGAIQYNDNIFLDATDTESDTIWVFSPGLELNFGQQPSNANLNITYVHDFVTYSDNSRLNRDNPDAKLKGFYRTAKSRINYGFSYKENSQNDVGSNLVGDIARRNIFTMNVDGEWDFSAKSSVSAGYQLHDVTYENPRFHDRDAVSVPVNYYWAVSPKLDMSVGYRFRNTSFARGSEYISQNRGDPFNFRPDYDDQFFNVGVRGEIGAKTTAEIRVGTQKRDFNTPGVSDSDLFSANARVVWVATAKSSLTFLYSRDFNADAFGTSIKSDDFQVAGSTKLSEQVSGFASLRFANDNYNGGRSDDGLFGQVGVTLIPNSYSTITLAYVIYNNDSNFAPADFDNNVINISGTLRY
ncbi:MAG: outer membrane beta-barrel protein [Verrucomicrobia bacterium]|nr:outer membrane beta-barrel protein [Verrucomicrobiota bacterium]